jgi:aminopeptidase N
MTTETAAAVPTSPLDSNSFANNHELVVKHIHLSLTADFDKKILSGHVELDVKVMRDFKMHSKRSLISRKKAEKEGVAKLVLDTSYLAVEKVSSGGSPLDVREFVINVNLI